MEKLIKPSEYAQELGISRQAVYAKIKRGILKSKNVEGKLYIIVDNSIQKKESVSQVKNIAITSKVNTNNEDYKSLLKAKDETISVLKGTVIDLKESNKQISTTLRGEIDLLKEAFHEMRTLYVHQLNYEKENTSLQEEPIIEVQPDNEKIDTKWVGLKKFFKSYNITKEKQKNKIKKHIDKAYKKGDKRIIKFDNKLKLNMNKTYKDILN